MATRLYIGGLSFETTDEELRDFFAQTGTVTSATVAVDRYSGRSRGFGFVEMATNAEARRAIEELNGRELGGRTITVEEARPRQDQGGGRGGRGRRQNGGGGRRW